MTSTKKNGAKFIRTAIATTVRNPGPGFESFLRYHLSIGISKIYVYFDDPKDIAQSVARQLPEVEVILCDAKYRTKTRSLRQYAALRPHLKSEVMARQRLNVDHAISRCLLEGIDWVFHIDGDELIDLPGGGEIGKFLSKVPTDVEQLILPNHEGVPSSMDVNDPFTEIIRFKTNHELRGKPSFANRNYFRSLFPIEREYFLGYQDGKAGARVSEKLYMGIVHAFTSTAGDLNTAMSSELVLNHYICSGYDQYLIKYRQLGDFADEWFKRQKIHLSFHLQSRDAYRAGDYRMLKQLYQSRVQLLGTGKIGKLQQGGYVHENRRISTKIKKILKNKKK